MGDGCILAEDSGGRVVQRVPHLRHERRAEHLHLTHLVDDCDSRALIRPARRHLADGGDGDRFEGCHVDGVLPDGGGTLWRHLADSVAPGEGTAFGGDAAWWERDDVEPHALTVPAVTAAHLPAFLGEEAAHHEMRVVAVVNFFRGVGNLVNSLDGSHYQRRLPYSWLAREKHVSCE